MPRVFVSYSHDSPEHVREVLRLSNRLRSAGVDAHLDQYEEAPPEGWPAWMTAQITHAQAVVMICTRSYHDRVMGAAPMGIGLGARWEGALITQQIYEDGGRNEKFIPVVLRSSDVRFIPKFVAATTRYDLSTADGYDRLYRRLTDQPLVERPPLGSLRRLDPQPNDALPKAVPAQGSGNWVLIWSKDGGIHLIEAREIRSGEKLQLTLAPTGSRQTAFLRSLSRLRDRRLMLAYADTGVVAQLQSIEETISKGDQLWSLRLRPEETDFSGGIMEAGTTGFSADDIANLRARRILLNEVDLPVHGDNVILESLIRGVSSAIKVECSPLLELYNIQREDPEFFLRAARLLAILWLRLSGTVEHILKLDLRLEGSRLDVDFEGRRARKYSNVDPPTIEVRGSLALE